ncbi:MAG: asparagine synthase (glutamine-hydrolyzing) [Pirellula sp.]
MCGITGYLNVDGAPAIASEIEKMVALIRHRGPDAEAWKVDRHVALGHTRLAIIDLQPESNQPFNSVCGRYCLVYNGEVFNYIELRAELEAAGCVFRTKSDTEVVLQAYIEWGDDCVKRFNGMWAFAIYDREQDRLFCSRDRYGIKPFVYAFHNNRFLFGSEIKPLLAVCPELKVPNYAAVAHCVKQGYSGGLESTCFDNVKRLLPSFNLVLHRGKLTFSRYWDYPTHADQNQDFESARERVEALLHDSVKLRMRSDVPVGITLSSGLDSTAIAHLMRRNSTERLHSFTSSYENIESEVGVASATSSELNLDFHAVSCSELGFLERITKIISHIESPHASSPMLPLWEIMRTARASVKVVLEGQGADELFAGYLPIYFGNSVMQSLKQFRLAEAWGNLSSAYRLTASHHLLGVHYFYSNLVRSVYPGSHKLIRRYGRGDESVYIGPLRDVPDYHMPETGYYDDVLNRRLAKAHAVELTNLLHYGDAISMAFGIESRLPFLDHRLVEEVFSLPASFKLKDGVTKRILREATKSFVPESIRNNRFKQGFTTPISTWFRNASEENVRSILLSDACKSRGLFDSKRLSAIIDLHMSGKRDFGPALFRWITCEIWFRQFIDT